MVEEGACLLGCEFIGKVLPRLDWWLRDLGGAIHCVWHDQAMPVDGGRLGQIVCHIDPHPVTLRQANARPRHLTVERVGQNLLIWQDVPLDHRNIQIEHFDAILDAWLQRLVAFCVGWRGVADRARIDGGHIFH